MRYQILINGAQGYAANQVKAITVKELKEALMDLEDDDEIVTYDQSNSYGAGFGSITDYIEEVAEEE